MTFRIRGSFIPRDRSKWYDPYRNEFGWRPRSREGGPVFRDLTWDFQEPDQYPGLAAEQKPGFMAGKADKALHGALVAADPEALLAVAAAEPEHRDLAATLAGLLILDQDLERGMDLLAGALATATDVGKDRFVHKYLPEAGLTVVIAAGVMAHLPLQRTTLILLLAELYQGRGEPERALELLDAAEQTTHVRLSKAEILYEAADYEGVLTATGGVNNDDDVTALMLAYRGRAFAELERYDEAIAALGRALEYPNRAEAAKAIALVGRGMVHQARGEDILAQNDFTQALMEVPDDPDAAKHIEQLIHGAGEG
jgi:tetratricopeptide (TPR) repeat protein